MKYLLLLSFTFSFHFAHATGLTYELAHQRSQQIKNVKYELFFKIDEGDKEFSGQEKIEFDLLNKSHPVIIDFEEGHVTALKVNAQVAEYEYNQSVISLKPTLFRSGPNTIEIEFTHNYSNSGAGLHRFKDPEDGKVYTYTQFEPFDANRVYPCFDQPDLKATFKLKVDAPESWTVISSATEIATTSSEKGRRIWTFPESAKFSTYLFSLHAGPYKVWEETAGEIKLRLFSRQTYAAYVPVKEWFGFTKRGLAYYSWYFNYPYPFKKYDQVVIPEFNVGAMENVAAVTFSEYFVKRGKPTEDDREELANTLLHEMAHMWFGNLVTMKWWSDLWLNESFATIMASQAVREITPFTKSWETFYASEKTKAYVEDQYVTTHPISGVVTNTDQAFANFDSITYGKGAAALRQLFFSLGAPAVQSGLQKYFKANQYSNTTIDNFIETLASASGKNLKRWKSEWLETAGLNALKPELECENNKIKSFRIVQSSVTDSVPLRRHSTVVGLFSNTASGDLAPFQSEKIEYSGPKTSINLFNGKKCPDVVFTNIEDYDYVKERFDSQTLISIQKNISKISDSFLRVKAWGVLWDMVRDGELSVQTYADMIFTHLAEEKEFKIIDMVLNSVHGYHGDPSVLYYLPKETQGAKVAFETFTNRLESFIWTQLKKSQAGSDIQKRWFDAYALSAHSKAAAENLTKMLKGKSTVKDFALDQDRRWVAVKAVAMIQPEKGSAFITAEKKRDPSQSGRVAAIEAESVTPSLKVKDVWYNKVLASDSGVSLSDARATLENLLPYDQVEARKHFADRYFKDVTLVNRDKGSDFQEVYARKFSVALCNQESRSRLSDFLNATSSLSPVLMKWLRISLQEDERCIKVRAKLEAGASRQ